MKKILKRQNKKMVKSTLEAYCSSCRCNKCGCTIYDQGYAGMSSSSISSSYNSFK